MRKAKMTNNLNDETIVDRPTSDLSRRDVLLGAAAALLTSAVPSAAADLTGPVCLRDRRAVAGMNLTTE